MDPMFLGRVGNMICHAENVVRTSVKWAKQNNIAIHESKFELITYRTPRSKLLEELSFTSVWLEYNTSSGQPILPSKTVKDLGVYLGHDLSWSVQAVQSAIKMANWILSVFSDRSKGVLIFF